MSWRSVLLLTVAFASGCRLATEGLAADPELSDDGGHDGARGEDTAPLFPFDDAAPMECDGKADGTPCTAGICVASVCLPPRCGDSFVSPGEDCDDGNEVDGDTCPGDCRYACRVDADCDDANICSTDTCDPTTHVCAPKTAANAGKPCTRTVGGPGVCKGTNCSSASCGNKAVEPPEQCDDGNLVDSDGCRSDCLFTCNGPADCDDKNACNGVEICTSAHQCVAGTPKVCNDGSACTNDRCSLATGACAYTKIDRDSDGFGPGAGCGRDCHDQNPAVFPGQPKWFVAAYQTPAGVRSWDYDCDGAMTPHFTVTGSCTKNGSECILRDGWAGEPPACGGGDFWIMGCVGGACRPELSLTPRAQECR